MKYIIGIIAIIAGTFMVLKTEWLVSTFGTSAWAEEHFRTSGGSRLLYKLIGIAIIFIAMMAMTGFLGPLLLGVLGRFFGA